MWIENTMKMTMVVVEEITLRFGGDRVLISPMQQINSNESNLKRKVPSFMNQTQLLHLRLGHINLDRIHRPVTSGHLSSLEVEALPVREPCLEGKMTMRPFKAKGNRVKEVLELVHTDLCGPMNT